MYSTLSADHYTSPDILALEQARIFRRLWVVAGFRSLLEAPDSFITHEIGGVPVLIQNTSNGLHAFVNQCAHRQSPIHTADFGRRRMACPYHGWVYDAEGKVKSIPGNEPHYGFPEEVVGGLGLRPVMLREVGGMLLVNLDEKPIPLEAQFGEVFLNDLAEVSSRVGDDAIFAKFQARYNWKLNFENVVDWNHVPFVHAASFASLMPGLRPSAPLGKSKAPPPEPDDCVEDDLRLLSYSHQSPFDFQDWPWYDLLDRCGPTMEYRNLFIYPNVNYVIMAGAVHLIQQFCPVAPDRTLVRLTMALGRRRGRLPAAPAILWSQMRSEKRVIDEDIVVLEGVQRGLGGIGSRPFHGAYESRLRRIAKTYRRIMAQE